MASELKVLIIEDNPDDAVLLVRFLKKSGHVVMYRMIDNQTDFQSALKNESWDIILSDFNVPHFSPLWALNLIEARELDIPFIIVSGTVPADKAVELMKAGANDYVMKDDLFRLVPAIERELREVQIRRKKKQAEEESLAQKDRLRVLVEELQRAVDSREELIAICSHELRTPITSMKLQTQHFIRALSKDNAKAFIDNYLHKFIINTNRQLDRLATLVDDMIDYSQSGSGLVTLNRNDQVDLEAVIHKVISKNQDTIDRSGSQISIHIISSAPISGDTRRLEQSFSNIFLNALRYGKGKPIQVSLVVDEKQAMISVEDHGIGIAPDDVDRIFKRFERAVSASDFSGLGLGLFMARKIVEAHQGQIRVASSLGKGSSFQIVLPRNRSQEKSVSSTSSAA